MQREMFALLRRQETTTAADLAAIMLEGLSVTLSKYHIWAEELALVLSLRTDSSTPVTKSA